jgi:Pyruvate/2-oxoacid:ferredoxin oxidoreductase delta subunit
MQKTDINEIPTEELYENLRQFLCAKNFKLPKDDSTTKLVMNMYPEEEARLVLTGFKKTFRPVTARMIRMRTGIQKEKLTSMLENMTYTGKLVKYGPFYISLPFFPGGFEFYFTFKRDDPQRMKMVAEAHKEHFQKGVTKQLSGFSPKRYRVIPAAKPIEKNIEINQSMNIKHDVLPFEVLKKYLSGKSKFALVPCSCREAAKLAGDPCKRTAENFCITAGILAKDAIQKGVGKEVSFDEVMEIMIRAEKEGLVHEAVNIQKTAASICNCCPCCCGYLKTVKEYNLYEAISKSNFNPVINTSACTLCDICMNKCPMEAISHQTSPPEKMLITLEKCIGCGICASNCPQDAITLEKVRNIIPPKSTISLFRKSKKVKT